MFRKKYTWHSVKEKLGVIPELGQVLETVVSGFSSRALIISLIGRLMLALRGRSDSV
jgi:hypothetical protein